MRMITAVGEGEIREGSEKHSEEVLRNLIQVRGTL
jgi:hypothetical protein